MATGDDERGPDGGNPEEGPVLAPEELDLDENEHVEKLDEGRFVVSPDTEGPDPAPTTSTTSGGGGPPESTAPPDRTAATEEAVSLEDASQEEIHGWLEDRFDRAQSRYGFDVTAKFDGAVSQRRMMSNDVVTIFESLILWYAQQIDQDTPVEEILGILLMESNVPIRYPPGSLAGLVESSDLGPDDSIAELLAAVESEDGVQL